MSFLPFDMEYLTEEMVEKAEKELGETPETRKEAVAKFRMQIDANPKLEEIPRTDRYLLQFLRPRKFDVKRALSLLRNYYYSKKHYPEIYTPDYEDFLKNFKEGIINILPYRDEEGSAILVLNLSNWNANEVKLSTIIHGVTVIAICSVDFQPATQICGAKVIINTKDMNQKHVWHMSPRYLHFIAKGVANALPIRIKGIHVINESSFVQLVWNILKLLLTEKIRKRVHFHSSIENLHKHMNPELLPEEYGGNYKHDNSFILQYIDIKKHRYHELMAINLVSKK